MTSYLMVCLRSKCEVVDKDNSEINKEMYEQNLRRQMLGKLLLPGKFNRWVNTHIRYLTWLT